MSKRPKVRKELPVLQHGIQHELQPAQAGVQERVQEAGAEEEVIAEEDQAAEEEVKPTKSHKAASQRKKGQGSVPRPKARPLRGSAASSKEGRKRRRSREEEQLDREVAARTLDPDDVPIDIKWRKAWEERKAVARRNDQVPIGAGEKAFLVVALRRAKPNTTGDAATGPPTLEVRYGTLHMAERILEPNSPGKEPRMIVKPGNATACGRLLGKDIRLYEHREIVWPDLEEGEFDFEKTCGRPGCKARLAQLTKHIAPRRKGTRKEEERLSSESSSSTSSAPSSNEQD
jgi:hypothetical protein